MDRTPNKFQTTSLLVENEPIKRLFNQDKYHRIDYCERFKKKTCEFEKKAIFGPLKIHYK